MPDPEPCGPFFLERANVRSVGEDRIVLGEKLNDRIKIVAQNIIPHQREFHRSRPVLCDLFVGHANELENALRCDFRANAHQFVQFGSGAEFVAIFSFDAQIKHLGLDLLM